MTYQELLATTAERKKVAIRDINKAITGPAGFLAKAEIEKDPGKVAWSFLAAEFCETLADHVGEFIEQIGDIESPAAREIAAIYMAYEDEDPDLYELLPVEAQLFEESTTHRLG